MVLRFGLTFLLKTLNRKVRKEKTQCAQRNDLAIFAET